MLVIGAATIILRRREWRKRLRCFIRAEHREYAQSAHMLIVQSAWERMAEDIRCWLERVPPNRLNAGMEDFPATAIRLEINMRDQ